MKRFPWDYALINLRRLLEEKGISNADIVIACRGTNQEHKNKKIKDSELRRLRRLKTGDTKLSLRDIILISQAIDVDPGDLSFMTPEEFEQKYIEPIKNSVGKIMVESIKKA